MAPVFSGSVGSRKRSDGLQKYFSRFLKKGLLFAESYVIIHKLTSKKSTSYPGVAQLVAHLTGGQGVVSSSLATRTTEKACNRNGYRLSSYLFSMGFPFSFPFTASEKRIYACSDGKVSAKKMSGEGHSPDTFSINFSILAALFCFIWSVTCP